MPKLEDVPGPAPLAPEVARPERWGGFGPMRLEAVSPAESHYPIFGIETDYLATPTGFGEWIPILPGEPIPRDVVVLKHATHLTFD